VSWFSNNGRKDRLGKALAVVIVGVVALSATMLIVGLAWAVCGLIVVLKTGNLVGWIAIVVGACLAPMWTGWSSWALVIAGVDLGGWSSLLGDVFDYTWVLAVTLVVVVLPLVFPTGRPPGRGWWWVLVVALFALVGGVVAVTEARKGWAPHSALQALSGFFADLAEPMPWLLFGLPLLVGAGGAAASVAHRLHIAGTVERHQAKWVVSALVVVGIVAVVGFLGPLEEFLRTPVGAFVVLGTYVLVPLAIVAAILRYRLFDIDRLVSRTIGYFVVAGVLSALYFGTVVVLRGWLPGRGQVPVAISTLLVAAAFQPLWRRVQSLVDRRFFRYRYDADRVIDRVIAELTATLDPESVATRTQAVVNEVFSPAQLGIWIAPDRQSRQ